MSYFDASDLTDVIDDMQDLLEEHSDYDSVELVENSTDYETRMKELIDKAKRVARDFVWEYEKMEDESERLESKVYRLESDNDRLERQMLEKSTNLYDLQKKKICEDLFKNLSLEQLEDFEKQAMSAKKNYHQSLLRDHC